jgi:hypothetical protein
MKPTAKTSAKRRNPRHCTGPKTPGCKARSRMNAVTHGRRGERKLAISCAALHIGCMFRIAAILTLTAPSFLAQTPKKPVTDTHGEVTVARDYRWLENFDEPDSIVPSISPKSILPFLRWMAASWRRALRTMPSAPRPTCTSITRTIFPTWAKAENETYDIGRDFPRLRSVCGSNPATDRVVRHNVPGGRLRAKTPYLATSRMRAHLVRRREPCLRLAERTLVNLAGWRPGTW